MRYMVSFLLVVLLDVMIVACPIYLQHFQELNKLLERMLKVHAYHSLDVHYSSVKRRYHHNQLMQDLKQSDLFLRHNGRG